MLPIPSATNHAPVTVALVASAAVNILLEILKQRYGVDFSGQETNLLTLTTGLGYLVAGKGAA